MDTIHVWTKQHICVWQQLQRDGIYHAKRSGILHNEDTRLMITAYDWLASAIPNSGSKPDGAEYPIWLAFSRQGTMLPTPDTVLLELEIDPALITHINIHKWGTILNCSYIPKDAADARRHSQLLRDYNISCVTACTTPFYPQIRREIQESWLRLFDDSIQLDNPETYGTIWEVRSEWVIKAEIL